MAFSMPCSGALGSIGLRSKASRICSSNSGVSSWLRPLHMAHDAPPPRLKLQRVLQSTHVSHRLATTAGTPAAAVVDSAASIESHPGWADCVAAVQALGCSDEQAATYVQRAFGWGAKSRAYWRQGKVQAAPNAAQVQCVLEYLRQLGLDDAGIMKVVQGFPEVLGCRMGLLEANVAKLEEEWKLKGDVRVKAILRQPGILGFTIDCMGDCAGECNRCWVRF